MAETNPTHSPSLNVCSTGTNPRPAVQLGQIRSRGLLVDSTATITVLTTTTQTVTNLTATGTVTTKNLVVQSTGTIEGRGITAGPEFIQTRSALCSTGTNVIVFQLAFGNAPDAVASYLSSVSTGIPALTVMGTTASTVSIRTAFGSTGYVQYAAFGTRP